MAKIMCRQVAKIMCQLTFKRLFYHGGEIFSAYVLWRRSTHRDMLLAY